ncbi:MAG TPA: TIGR01777 family oxidoreductase [Ramlibacter sp.]|nr:TIGR01777 family oxidoreductase [Ramlibacter sp.]
MNIVFGILLAQIAMGALDNFWHHEIAARLPHRASARHELKLHAAREGIYGVLLVGLSWLQWHGPWVLLPAALMVAEVAITCADFVEEDRTRRLPPFEAVLHTLLAVNYGVLLGVLGLQFAQWWQLPPGWARVDHGLLSWFFTLSGIAVIAWAVRNVLAVYRLGLQPEPLTPPVPASGPAVLVTGATGFIGSALVRQLVDQGQRVIVHSRDLLQARREFPAAWVVDRLDDIPAETHIHAVVHLAGAAILGAPWTRGRRQSLVDSRTNLMHELLLLMSRMHERPAVLVGASAVGYYGAPDGDPVLDESAPPQPGRFQSELCISIEHEARRAEALGVRVVRMRFGIVLGTDGGAYPALATAARFGCGALLAGGRQPVPWIHIDDAVGLVRFAIANRQLQGAVNAVAPEVPTQEVFARHMAASFGRRVVLRVPDALLRWGLGEMSELLRLGQRAVPAAALAAGYRFRVPEVLAAMRLLAGDNPGPCNTPHDNASLAPLHPR